MSSAAVDKLSDKELLDALKTRIEKRFKDTGNHNHRMEYMYMLQLLQKARETLLTINKDLVKS